MAKILSAHTSGTVGTIVDAPGGVAPVGTLLAFGQTLNAVTNPQYQPLYNIIGNTYGGTDNTNFVVPDCRGRALVGKDNMGGSAANRMTSGGSGINGTVLGAAGGTETHALDITQIPNHKHEQDHTNASPFGAGTTALSGGSAYSYSALVNGTAQLTNGSGGNGSHQNTQPTIIVNKAICYL